MTVPRTLQPPVSRRGLGFVLEWGEEVLLALVIVLSVLTFGVRVVSVSGSSMAPTYGDGDRLLVVRLLDCRPGDVIVSGIDKQTVKRVIATQGQTVSLDDVNGTVLIDGYPLDETLFGLENGTTCLPYSSLERTRFPVTVPKGYVFVLGDNRAVSMDSRYAQVGMVDLRSVVGKVILNLGGSARGSTEK